MLSSDWWKPYESSSKKPWNIERVVHLHRRAAWGATWQEIERDLQAGPQASITRLLQEQPNASPLDVLVDQLEFRAEAQQQIEPLQAAWIMRMWHGTDPFGEQVALMWHNHFATSYLKVRDVGVMRNHLHTLREYGRKPFPELLTAIMRDPAMLV